MRVLVAIDGSAAAYRAVELATAIRWPAGSELRVVSIVEPLDEVLAAAWGLPASSDSQGYSEEDERKALSIVEEAAGALAQPGVTISQSVARGRPANKVLEIAHDFVADLIIVGSRGHGTIASMVLGSVSAEIADHAHCPVLVARSPGMSRAILAVDGSTFARKAEEVVASWPIFGEVAIDVVNVAEISPSWATGLAVAAYASSSVMMAESTVAVAAEHEAIYRSAVARLHAAGRSAVGRVLRGDAATELLAAAEATHADLIVVGTHGRTGVTRAVFGSVARNVMLHAKCSVLVVREVNGPPQPAV